MKRLLFRVFKKTRLIFDLHQPRFLQLDCIDLVLENRQLLLLNWNTTHSSKICIRPGNSTFRNPSGAAICKLPAGTATVLISIHNLWRSKRMSFTLKRIAVDRQTFQYFDELFLCKIDLPDTVIPTVALFKPMYHEKNIPEFFLTIPAPVFNITINHSQLTDYAP